MAKKWAEVVDSEAFQALPDDQKEVARNQYFDSVVAPQVPETDLDAVRQQFLSTTSLAPKRAPAKAAPAPQGGGFEVTNPAGDGFGASIMDAARATKRKNYTGSVFDTISPDEGVVFDPAEAERLSRRAYAEETTKAPRRQFEMRPASQRATSRDTRQAITDTYAAVWQGGIGTLKGITDNINAGENPLSDALGAIDTALEQNIKSPYLRNLQASRQGIIDAARKNQGEVAATRAAFSSMFSPAGADIVARGAGSMLPTIGMSLAQLGAKSMVAVNALSTAGEAANQSARALRNMSPEDWSKNAAYQELRDAGMSHRDSVTILAPIYALPAQSTGYLAGRVAGSTGFEKTLTGKATSGAAIDRAKRSAAEMGGEQLETLAPQLVGNIVQGAADERTSAIEGLGQAAVETAAGAFPGSALAALRSPEGGAAKTQQPDRYQRPDATGELQAQLLARSKGFLVPERRNQMAPPAAPTAQPTLAKEEQLAALTAEIEATGIPAEDARVQAQQMLAMREAEERKALAPRIVELTREFVDNGMEPQQANQLAIQQATEEAQADAQAEREGAISAQPTVSTADRAGAGVAGQPGGVAPTARVGEAEPTGVVPAGQTAAGTVAGAGEKPTALTAEPPVPEGYVRVYHSGAKGEGEFGRWASTDRKYAANYRPNLPLFYTDIPADDPRVNNPDYPDTQGVKQGFTFNFELTPQEATTLTETPRDTEAPKTKRGRPTVLTAEEKQQRAEDKRPVQAAKAKAERSLIRLTNKLDELATLPDEGDFETDEDYEAAVAEHRAQRRETIKSLLQLQADPLLRGTKVGERVKVALARPDVSEKEKADLKAGIEAQKRAQAAAKGEQASSSRVGKDMPDTAFNKFTNGVQALNHIIKTGNDFQKMLGKRLRNFVTNVRFVVIEEGQELPAQLKKPKNARQWERSIGLYIENFDTGDRVIYVRGASFGENQGINNLTILHELLHAATNRKVALAIEAIQKGVGLNSPLVRSATDLLRTMNSAISTFNELERKKELPQHLLDLADYGAVLQDPREFIAYGMTDPDFQQFLMKAKGYEEDTSYFKRFVRGIRELFGMGEDTTNAFTDLIVVTDTILSTRAPQYQARGEQASSMFGLFGGKKAPEADEPLPDETSVKAKPSANVQRLAKMLGSKLYGTPKDIALVSVKELFQNSFDAIKGSLEQGQLTRGRVDVKIDRSDRSIRVVDNGLGMPTSVMGNQFLQIAGTVKETKRASGGLGVAKMLFLFENKQLEVVSLRDGRLSRMVTTGDDLKAALDDPDRAPNIEVTTDPETIQRYVETLFPDGHGTSVTVTIPETFTNESTGEKEKINFDTWDIKNAPVLEYSPLFGDIDVNVDYGFGPETYPIGANFPANDYTPFANVNFAWGTARIYVSKEKTDPPYKGNTHILSNGLWQFDTSLKDRPGFEGKQIKRTFYVDVTPAENVKPEDAGYPFDLNRQNFSAVAKDDFGKIFNYITAIYSQLDLAAGVKNFGTVQYVNSDGTLTDATTLEPSAPPTDNAFTLIKPGDEVEVRDGVLYVNNRPLPELTAKDLEKTSIRVDELTIPQDEIDSTKVMVHDNTETETRARVPEEDALKALKELESKDPTGYSLTDLGNGRYWMNAYGDNGEVLIHASGTPSELVEWAISNGISVETPTGAPQSLSDLARDQFGAARVNKYFAAIGDTFHLLRDALLSVDNSYSGMADQAFGVSIDNEYYGVSIMVPFKGMFINPATTDLRDTPAQVAVSMIGTMIHEMAHYRVRNHGGSFASEMQKIMTLLDTHPSFDLQQAKKDLTKFITDNDDIFQFLNKEFRSGNLKPRGNRFQDASYQQIGNEGAPDAMESERQTGQGGPGVPEQLGASAQGTGQVGQPAGNGGQTTPVGNAVRTQQQLNRAVKVASAKFDESQNGDEYSKAVSLLQMMQDPRKVIPAIRDLYKRMNMGARNALTYAMTTDFMVEMAGKDVPELRNTDKLLQQMSGMTQTLLKAAGDLTNDISRAFRKDPTLRKKLDRITHEATLAEYDPADKSQTVRSKRLDQMYADLGEEGQRVYNRIKRHFEVLSNYFSKLLDDQITQSGLPIAEQANLIKKIRAMYETGSKITPYFPLVRRGDFWLSIGTGETRKFFMYESMGERDRAMQGFADEKVKQKSGESNAAFQKRRAQNMQDLLESEEFVYGNDISALRKTTVGNSQLLSGVFAEIDKTGAKTDFTPEAKEQLKDAVYQLYLQTMPEQSFRKQFIHRKGFAGFRTDLLRNVADTTTKMATQLARIKYAPLLRNSLSQARDSIKNRPMYEPYVSAFERRVSDALSAGKPSMAESIAALSNKFSFIFYLGGMSSAMLQPLSLFQTGIPVLTKYGVGKAYAEMGNMLKVWNEFGVMQKNADGTFSWVPPSIENVTRSEDERRAIKDMMGRDLTTSTYARDALDYKATPTDDISSPKVQFAKDTVSALVLGGLMHSTERLSRESMFLAAYRLNRKAGRDHETSVDNAVYDTNEALGNYGQYNRPDFMQGAPGKILTQFMMYPVYMTAFLGRNFVEMIKPMNGRTRWEASKKFFGTMGHTWVLGGAVGLWGFSTVMGFLGAMWNSLKDDEWPEDVKSMGYELWWRTVWLREQLGGTQVAGYDLADIIERGPVNAITGADFSGRTSLNNMWLRETKETATPRESAIALAVEKAGPTANMILSWTDAYSAFMDGDYKKGALKAAPAGFRNYINTYTYWKEGAKDNKGTQILSRDAFTTGDLIFQAVGFRSDLLANTQYVTFKVIGLEQKILNERTKILNRLDRAYREQDFDDYTKSYKDMDKFNRKYPTYEISTDNLVESLERKQEQRASSFRGVTLTEKNVAPFSEALLPSRIAADKREEKNRAK